MSYSLEAMLLGKKQKNEIRGTVNSAKFYLTIEQTYALRGLLAQRDKLDVNSLEFKTTDASISKLLKGLDQNGCLRIKLQTKIPLIRGSYSYESRGITRGLDATDVEEIMLPIVYLQAKRTADNTKKYLSLLGDGEIDEANAVPVTEEPLVTFTKDADGIYTFDIGRCELDVFDVYIDPMALTVKTMVKTVHVCDAFGVAYHKAMTAQRMRGMDQDKRDEFYSQR